jgi:serine/threonine protein phosphatase PrpC
LVLADRQKGARSMHATTHVDLPSTSVALHVSASSDTGAVRRINEDSFAAEFPLFVVADGMGGHAHGDQASQAAVAVLSARLIVDPLPTAEEVVAAIGLANDAVVALSADNEDDQISGTTLAGVSLVRAADGLSTHWMAFNIGDSRVYTWDGRTLQQLSVDHSAVQELVDAGELTELEAREHPDRNIVTRAMGARRDVDADIWLLPVANVRAFLICSDGLTKELDDATIADLIAVTGGDPLTDVSDTLVAAALRMGGRDNITAVYVESTPVDELVASDSTNQRTLGLVHEDTTPRI